MPDLSQTRPRRPTQQATSNATASASVHPGRSCACPPPHGRVKVTRALIPRGGLSGMGGSSFACRRGWASSLHYLAGLSRYGLSSRPVAGLQLDCYLGRLASLRLQWVVAMHHRTRMDGEIRGADPGWSTSTRHQGIEVRGSRHGPGIMVWVHTGVLPPVFIIIGSARNPSG